jgi:RNA polymerase sigma-70 factor, ECF subfamily
VANDVISRSRKRLMCLARRLLRNVLDAEDAVQETYLRWHQHQPNATCLDAWLSRVLVRICIDRSRYLKRNPYGSWQTVDPDKLPGRERFTPEIQALQNEALSAAIGHMLTRLSPDERMALTLREIGGHDYREISKQLSKSPEACRQLVHRAKSVLRSSQE